MRFQLSGTSDDLILPDQKASVGLPCHRIFRAERVEVIDPDYFSIEFVMIGGKAQWPRESNGPTGWAPSVRAKDYTFVKWDTMQPNLTLWFTVRNVDTHPRQFKVIVHGVAV